MNKFVFAVQDAQGKIHFGIVEAQGGGECRCELIKRYPNANGMNLFGYTGKERTEDVHIHLPTKVMNSQYSPVTVDDKLGTLVTKSTFDPPVTIGIGERLSIVGNTYKVYRVSDGSTISTGRIIDAGSFIPASESDSGVSD